MTEKLTALDEIKSIEAQTRKLSLIEVLADLKQKAKVIKENKHFTDCILEEMGYSEKEIKSIIDYINSQVSIDESDIKEDAKESLEKKKEKAFTKMKDSPNFVYTSANTDGMVTNTTSTPYYGTTLNLCNAVSSSDMNFVTTL